jgi:hypothetical protein
MKGSIAGLQGGVAAGARPWGRRAGFDQAEISTGRLIRLGAGSVKSNRFLALRWRLTFG